MKDEYGLSSIGVPFIFNYNIFGKKNFVIHSGAGINYRILNKSTTLTETDLRRRDGSVYQTLNPQHFQVFNNIGVLMRLGITTRITSKSSFRLEARVHRMERFGDIFIAVPINHADYWYKYTMHGYSFNASIGF